jgi:hypothetical protein
VSLVVAGFLNLFFRCGPGTVLANGYYTLPVLRQIRYWTQVGLSVQSFISSLANSSFTVRGNDDVPVLLRGLEIRGSVWEYVQILRKGNNIREIADLLNAVH